MRELKRSIAKHIMKSRGYTRVNKRKQGWTRYNDMGHIRHDGRSFFATFWRNCEDLKDRRTREEIMKSAKRDRKKKSA